jgi:hypothetical protein
VYDDVQVEQLGSLGGRISVHDAAVTVEFPSDRQAQEESGAR